jgi:peptidylamidoglycolate lyase
MLRRILLTWVFATCLPLFAGDKPSHYVFVSGWPQLPEGETLGVCAGVGVDSRNQVFVFHRRERKWTTPFAAEPIAGTTVSVFDGGTGKLLNSWGAGLFILPHGLSVDHADHLWLTDVALHQVYEYTEDGKLLLTLGERGKPGNDHTHFNEPTGVAVLPDGSFYVSDGYKNTRVIKFSAAGEYEFEWGGKGKGPGEFNLPHGIALDSQGKVYVCDRSNSRLQIFDAKGKFLDQWKGPQIGKPYGVAVDAAGHVFVVDGGDAETKSTDRGKVVELDASAKMLDSFGPSGKGPGQIGLGHDIAVGPDGAVYIGDSGGKKLLKFARKE